MLEIGAFYAQQNHCVSTVLVEHLLSNDFDPRRSSAVEPGIGIALLDVTKLTRRYVDDDMLYLKASAGGSERGLANRWELPADSLLRKYAETKAFARSLMCQIDQLIANLVERQREVLREEAAFIPVLEAGNNHQLTDILSRI